MKIGVLGCFYGCEDLLPEVLAPWLELKAEGYDIDIAAVHGQFKEYADLGFDNDDEATIEVLRKYGPHFSSLDILPEPQSEADIRTLGLKRLQDAGADFVWLLDGDEVYSVDEIKHILYFLGTTPEFDYYHIYLKNYIFESTEWQDDFFPPRIFRMERHGGLSHFEWDNDLVYADGARMMQLTPGIIPKSLAHVTHYTWRTKDAAKKIAYQRKHFGYSIMREVDGKFSMDPAYFAHFKMPMPEERDGVIASAPKPALDVILRTHASGNFRDGMPRVTDAWGKEELTIRSLRSIVYALLRLERRNDVSITLSVLDDHSNEAALARMQKLLNLCPFKTELVSLEERGNGPSFKACLERGRLSEGLIYFVEDDYIHEATAIEEMWDAYHLFSKNIGRKQVAIFPVDYSDFYLPKEIIQTRVVAGAKRHWRVSYSTTNTFLIPQQVLIDHYARFLKNTETLNEENSFNPVWRGPTTLFSPIPTLAIHMNDEDLMPPFSNWQQLWNSLAEYDEPGTREISTVISVCSLDAAFLRPILDETKKFCDDIILVGSDHLLNGEKEDLAYLDFVRAEYPDVQIHFMEWHKDPPPRYWHNRARWEGIRRAKNEWVLMLDGDEVPDGARMREYLASIDFSRDGYAFACWWYFREPVFRATTTSIAGLLMPKRHLIRQFVFSESERGAFRDSGLDVEEPVMLGGEPLVHHFSWARTKAELLKKVTSWAHRNEGGHDWVAIVEQEFSHPFEGTEKVHGFSYETVPNRFNIKIA